MSAKQHFRTVQNYIQMYHILRATAFYIEAYFELLNFMYVSKKVETFSGNIIQHVLWHRTEWNIF